MSNLYRLHDTFDNIVRVRVCVCIRWTEIMMRGSVPLNYCLNARWIFPFPPPRIQCKTDHSVHVQHNHVLHPRV